jgi:hypothetical protein
VAQRPAEKWPTYALENLEDSLYRLKQLERKADAIQDAILAGNDAAALKDLSDVRVLALECVDNLVRSRIGKYQQQERPRRWKRPMEEQSTQATSQVMATRR